MRSPHNTAIDHAYCETRTINKYPGPFRVGSKIVTPCTHWWKNGTCPYGDSCRYAHQPICTKDPNCPHKKCFFRHVEVIKVIIPEQDDSYDPSSEYTDDSVMVVGYDDIRKAVERQVRLDKAIGIHNMADGVTPADRIHRLETILLEKIDELEEKDVIIQRLTIQMKRLTTQIEQLENTLDDCAVDEHMLKIELDQERKKPRYLSEAEWADQQILGYV